VGRLSWGAEVKIVHPETGAAMPPDVPGELWVRGPFVMKGKVHISMQLVYLVVKHLL